MTPPMETSPSHGKRPRASSGSSDVDAERPKRKQARGKAAVRSVQANDFDSLISPSLRTGKKPPRTFFPPPLSSAAPQSNRRGHTQGLQLPLPPGSKDGAPAESDRAPDPYQPGSSVQRLMAETGRAEDPDAATQNGFPSSPPTNIAPPSRFERPELARQHRKPDPTVTRFESYVVIVEVRGDEDPTNIRVIRDIQPDVELDDRETLWEEWGKVLFRDTMLERRQTNVDQGERPQADMLRATSPEEVQGGTPHPDQTGWWQKGRGLFDTVSDRANGMNDSINKKLLG